MQRLIALPVPVIGILLFVGCSSPSDPVAKLKPLEGHWVFVVLDDKGKKADTETLKKMSVVIAKDKLQIANNDALANEYVMRVDPAMAKGEVDFVVIQGPDIGGTHHGIYELNNETLKICTSGIGKPRPTQMTGKSQDAWVLFELKRKN
jgi:uncharacterized protein (TIGR03067 family)